MLQRGAAGRGMQAEQATIWVKARFTKQQEGKSRGASELRVGKEERQMATEGPRGKRQMHGLTTLSSHRILKRL